MKQESQTYQSYLLRLRYFDDEGRRSWRMSLQQPGSGVEISFHSLDDLHTFLAELMAGDKGSDESPGKESITSAF